MPWNESTQVMARPEVGIGDISKAVHYSSTDLGTLITNGIINKWARYKPFRDSTQGYASTNDSAWLAAARAANFGLYNGGNYYTYVAGTLATVWTYLRPRGKGQGDNGANEWFRALDFQGYDARAVPPVSVPEHEVTLNLVAYQQDYPLNALLTEQIQGTGSLDLGDIASFDGYYLGVCFSQDKIINDLDWVAQYYKSSSQTIDTAGQGGGGALPQLILTTTDLNTLYTNYAGANNKASFYVYIFAVNTRISSLGPISQSMRFRSLPCDTPGDDMTVKLTLSKEVVKNCIIATYSLNSNPSQLSNFSDASPYRGDIVAHPTPVSSDYLLINTNTYQIAFGITITGLDDTAMTIPVSGFTLHFDHVFGESTGHTGGYDITPSKILNGQLQQITTSFTVAKGGTATIYALLPANSLKESGSLPLNEWIEPIIQIRSNGGYNWPAAVPNMKFRMRNY